MINSSSSQKSENKQISISMNKGEILESDVIRFEDVPICTPNGDILVEKINIELKPGMNCVISGPNGCGKSSLFRILGSLWPISGGKLYRPKLDRVFYIPQVLITYVLCDFNQRPYLPPGTLRDQVIYPHSKLQMLRRRVSDEDIKQLLKEIQLEYLIDREGGLDAINDWNDVLSGENFFQIELMKIGGEKQRMAMARLFYHRPQFAILGI